MRTERVHGSDRDASTAQPDVEYYMPGMPRLSSEPGRVERFVAKLLRRRGGLRAVIRRRDE